MKNSWISCVALSLCLAIVWAASVTDAAAKKKRKSPGPEELTNFLLSPDRSQWLIGAISKMATPEEIEAYLALTSDEEADACVNTPNDGYCDNGLYCDGAETCDAALGCQAGTALDCDDSGTNTPSVRPRTSINGPP